MGWTLVDLQSNRYDFNNTWHQVGLPWAKRSRMRELAYAHGGVDGADGKVKGRAIRLRGIIHGDTIAEYECQRRDLFAMLAKDDLQLSTVTTKYLKVKRAVAISDTAIAGRYLTAAELEIRFLLENPFWVYASQVIDTQTIASSPYQWQVNNDKNIEVAPILEITASASCTDVTVKNITDNNRSFDYDDTSFTSGVVVTADCEEGTVDRDATNTIRFFDGRFLRLLPGPNTLEYTGGNCTFKTKFYKRELV